MLDEILDKINKLGTTIDKASSNGIPFEVSVEKTTLTNTFVYGLAVALAFAVFFGFAYYVANKALGK